MGHGACYSQRQAGEVHSMQGQSPKEMLEPMVTLQVAAELIPMTSVSALYQFLFHHKDEFPPRYKKVRWYEIRMLTHSEIVKIREMTLISWEDSRYNPTRRAQRAPR